MCRVVTRSILHLPKKFGSKAFAGSCKEGFAQIISLTSLRKVDVIGSIALLRALNTVIC